MQKVARDLCKFVLETWPVCGNPLETWPMQNLARDLPGAGDLLRSYTSGHCRGKESTPSPCSHEAPHDKGLTAERSTTLQSTGTLDASTPQVLRLLMELGLHRRTGERYED